MKRYLIICATAAALALPAVAEDQNGDLEEGMSLIERGTQLMMRGLLKEMEPRLEELEDIVRGMEPQLRDLVIEMEPILEGLGAIMDDLDAYHPPERMPNGDIIIRRKTPFDSGEIEI